MRLPLFIIGLSLGEALATAIPRHTDVNLPRCESSESNGFRHPGIYHDCRSLDRIQANYQSGKRAYVDAFASVVDRTSSFTNTTWAMAGPFASVNWAGGDGHNIPLQSDGKNAYMLTLGWYATGNVAWLERAKSIILAWGSTLRVLNEQIQGGEGLAYMTASAEILRASAKHSGWTPANTASYLEMIHNITIPWTASEGLTRNNFFMNQGFYGNNGVMTIAVFSENRTMYEDMVYYATVGANPDPSIDYAIPLQISGKPEYYGQVTEMGRDQAHPMGTLRGLCYMGLTSAAQKGVDFFDLHEQRLLAGFEYWATYNNGSEVPWEPRHIRPTSTEWWNTTNPSARGRNYEQYWMPVEAIGVGYYEYYKRNRGCKMGHYSEYMSWQGVGWSTFEWGFDEAIHHIGYDLTVA